MLIRGNASISGSCEFNKYSILQINSGFNSAINYVDFTTAGTKIINCLNVLGDKVSITGINYAPNREVKLFLLTTGSVNQFIYPSGNNGWHWITSRPSGINSGKALVITLVSTGTSDAGCYASFGMEI